jgi:hypothetical protein
MVITHPRGLTICLKIHIVRINSEWEQRRKPKFVTIEEMMQCCMGNAGNSKFITRT